MHREAFEHHLTSPQGRGHHPPGAATVTAGDEACCDRITFSVELSDGRIVDAGFTAEGCGSAAAAGSAAVTLLRGAPLLEAGRVGARAIARELGGLSPGKMHAAELAADAAARSLGRALVARPVTAEAASGHADPRRPARTLVAMSGGVDSAVAAQLSVAQGETAAVTLELFSDRENDADRSCCSASAVAGARTLAHAMGLPHFTIDLRDAFRAGVVTPFIAGYAGGETPNPCVSCNGAVRLDAMLELADRLGCRVLATGHYARIAEREDPNGPLLRVAADPDKDQTYMLVALAPGSLERMRFPLGELRKPQVRELAAAAGLSVAGKPESQDLCFLAGTTRPRFLARHGGPSPETGEIVTADGAVVGRHRGHHCFTVGQRRGLGVATGSPLYVLDKDAERNRVIVGPREALETTVVSVRDATLRRPASRVDRVRLRYRSRPVAANVVEAAEPGRHARLALALERPVDGAAPGQIACLMDGELVIGWGTIARPQSLRTGPG